MQKLIILVLAITALNCQSECQGYAPVCGNNNVTYSNACSCMRANVGVQYATACNPQAPRRRVHFHRQQAELTLDENERERYLIHEELKEERRRMKMLHHQRRALRRVVLETREAHRQMRNRGQERDNSDLERRVSEQAERNRDARERARSTLWSLRNTGCQQRTNNCGQAAYYVEDAPAVNLPTLIARRVEVPVVEAAPTQWKWTEEAAPSQWTWANEEAADNSNWEGAKNWANNVVLVGTA